MSLEYLHSMIRVSNLDSALNFFCDKLGFIETSRKESEKGRFTLVFLVAPHDQKKATKTNAPMLELTYNWDEKNYDGGRNYNIYELCQRLMDKGVTINRPPRDGHMAFIKSPDGISLELLQKGDSLEPQEPWASMENSGSW